MPNQPSTATHAQRLRRAAGPLLSVTIVALAFWGVHGMLAETSPALIAAALLSLSPAKALLALGCTALSFVVLTQYDALGLRWVGRAWPWRSSAPGTALAYALGNVSFNALVVGGAVRYSRWRDAGMQPGQVARVALFASLGFWLGYMALGGMLFLADPLRPSVRAAGLLLLVVPVYLLLALRARVFRLGRWQLALPPAALCVGQIVVGILDLLCISGVLWLLLPPLPGLGYSHFLQAFMLATVAGSASHAPGGLGVFDSAFLLLLPAGSPVPQVVAALLAFRVIYYGMPLAAAGVALTAGQLKRRLRPQR